MENVSNTTKVAVHQRIDMLSAFGKCQRIKYRARSIPLRADAMWFNYFIRTDNEWTGLFRLQRTNEANFGRLSVVFSLQASQIIFASCLRLNHLTDAIIDNGLLKFYIPKK